MARHIRLCVTAVLLLPMIGACGARQNAASQPTLTTRSTTTAPASSSSSEAPPPADGSRCTAELLAGYVETMNAPAGQRSVILVVKNTSKQTCTLSGFGGLELLSATKEPIPTNAERTLQPAPTLVTLAPGKEAGKILQWTVVATGDEPTTGPCQPLASSVNVLPPDETTPFEVDYELGSVCNQGRIDTSAYFPR